MTGFGYTPTRFSSLNIVEDNSSYKSYTPMIFYLIAPAKGLVVVMDV